MAWCLDLDQVSAAAVAAGSGSVAEHSASHSSCRKVDSQEDFAEVELAVESLAREVQSERRPRHLENEVDWLLLALDELDLEAGSSVELSMLDHPRGRAER